MGQARKGVHSSCKNKWATVLWWNAVDIGYATLNSPWTVYCALVLWGFVFIATVYCLLWLPGITYGPPCASSRRRRVWSYCFSDRFFCFGFDFVETIGQDVLIDFVAHGAWLVLGLRRVSVASQCAACCSVGPPWRLFYLLLERGHPCLLFFKQVTRQLVCHRRPDELTLFQGFNSFNEYGQSITQAIKNI